MNTELVKQAAAFTLEGSKPFPEIVGMLIEAGVESYHVDYIALRKTFYSSNGETLSTSVDYEGLPPVQENFDLAALRSDILDSQQKGQKYREFTVRAMKAGVQGYLAFLRGKRVIYFGRQGDQHTEWFPGMKPNPE